MLGNEVCLLAKPKKSEPLFAVSWFYPNSYAVGMTGLGYQLVWSLLDCDQQTIVHRGFTDFHENGISESELFGFTLSWELDFINIIKLLEKHGVKATSQERSESEPIVFGGGPVLTANPEPFADIFDLVLLGDAEVVVPSLITSWKEARQLKSRQKRLEHLASVPGIYVPSLYAYQFQNESQSLSAIVPMLEAAPSRLSKQLFTPPANYVAHSHILSPDTTWGDMFLVEVVRSCPQECRFCLASFLTRPFRSPSVETIMAAIDLGLKHTRKIGLLGPSVTEHPQFDEIASALKQRENVEISIASIRADTISAPILQVLTALGQRSVTIAIESGSERLRQIMKKNLSQAEIEQAVDLVSQSGMESLKFYGMVGLPYEEENDLDETIALMTKLKREHRHLRFVFGVSSFVPKAQTPFQWTGRDKKAQAKLEYLRKNLSKIGISVRPESANWSDIQALLSRGDRRLTPVLLETAHKEGNLGAWKRSLRQHAQTTPSLDFYAFRNIPEAEFLPWSHLVDQAKTDYLDKHLASAQNIAQTISSAI